MWSSRLTSPAADLGPAETALRLTAIVLLLRPAGHWAVCAPALALAGLALALPRVLRAPATWYALALLVSLRIVFDWPLPDNHVYLLAYWCLAVALALGVEGGRAVLGRSSRLLVGCAFLMAFFWKAVLSPDYTDGRFFRVTLLTDERFEEATRLLGGMTAPQLEQAREYLTPLPEGAELLDDASPVEPQAFRRLVGVSTWGLLFVEALIALACLVPPRGRAAPLPHLLLLLFCVVTYAFAPVAGFGWLLLAMGLAACEPGQRRLRAAYVAAWCLVLLYDEAPWARLLLNWLDPV